MSIHWDLQEIGPNPSIMVSTGIKIRGKPLKLYFGTERNRGRLLGFGMIPHENKQKNALQFFRMDWHSDHGQVPSVKFWKDGSFHYHVE